MVSTHTRRPRSAARNATAAAVVVLPTPPAPQQTMMAAVSSSSSTSNGLTTGQSPQLSLLQPAGQLVEPGQVRRRAEQGKLDRRLTDGPQEAAFALLEQDPAGVVGRLTGKRRDRRVGGIDPDGLQPAHELGAVEASRSDV